MKGTAYGVGVGPGDPELMTLKAVRVIRETSVIAFPGKEAEMSLAYRIAAGAVPELAEKELLPIPMPMTKDRERLREAHRKGAERLKAYLDSGRNVVYLILGDPSLYGSFLYLQRILEADGYPVELVSGVPSFCAAAARLGVPLAEGDGAVHIVPAGAALPDGTDTCVLMKASGPVRELLDAAHGSGRTVQAVENCGMDGEAVYRSEEELPERTGYFTVMIAKTPEQWK